MPLIDEPPPRHRPVDHRPTRSFTEGSGSVHDIQSRSVFPSRLKAPVGMRNMKPLALSPASSRSTEQSRSSDSRLARTHPALPPPTTMMSASINRNSPPLAKPGTAPTRWRGPLLCACSNGRLERQVIQLHGIALEDQPARVEVVGAERLHQLVLHAR